MRAWTRFAVLTFGAFADARGMPAAAADLAAGTPQSQQAGEAGKPTLLVTKITSLAKQTCPKSKPKCASLGDEIVVWVRTSDELSAYNDYARAQKKDITLFLNGNDTGIAPKAIGSKEPTLTFELVRNGNDEQNKRIWAGLLRNPFIQRYRDVEASVGLAGGVAQPAEQSTFTLALIKVQLSWLWLVAMILVLAAFFWLVVARGMLRDGPKPAPYSLGRVQMAWWFLLILLGYVVIWVISGDRDAITESLLVLMGISAGTGLGAVLINSGGGVAALSQATSERLALEAAEQSATQKVATATANVTAAPADLVAQKLLADAQAELNTINARLTAINNQLNALVVAPQSRGWVRDILADDAGNMQLHRFQIVVWTVVLGIIFATSVVTQLSMPVFSPTLLTLMGISSGTYLGFKFPEK